MPYMRKLDHALRGGPQEACFAWLEAVEGSLLSAEWEDAATMEVAKLPCAAEALEEVLCRPRFRLFYYAASFRERNRLLALVQRRLSELGVEVLELRLRAGRAVLGDGTTDDEGVAVVVEGPGDAVEGLRRLLAERAGRGEPVAMGQEATLEEDGEREARADALRSRLASAVVGDYSSGEVACCESRDGGSCVRGSRAAARAAAKATAAADENLRPWFAACPPRTPRLSLLDPKASPPAGRFQPDLRASASSPSLPVSSKYGRPAVKRRSGHC